MRADEVSKAEVAKRGKAATVFVAGKRVTGSGFCIHPAGLFVTNEHVVRDSEEAKIVLNAGLKNQQVLMAKVVRTDKKVDLALLRVDDEKDLPALALGSDDKISELDEVIVCGFPFGKSIVRPNPKAKNDNKPKEVYPAITINAGSITSLREKEGELEEIQIDADINPGNSGGPVLDRKGKVIGVAVSGLGLSRVKFAVPVRHLARFLEKPEILFTPPTVTRSHMHEPVEFQARVASLLPDAASFKVEMVLQAGDAPARRLEPEFKDGVYRVLAVPVLLEKNRRLVVAVQFDDASAEGVIEDRDIRVGDRKLKLSACQRVMLKPESGVVLEGKKIQGEVSGLDKLRLPIGGQMLDVDVTRARTLVIQPVAPPSSIECTLVASRNGKEIGRLETRIPIQGVALVEKVDPSATAIAPPVLTSDVVTKNLPEIASDICVGGGGRYFILLLPKLKKLAVFDVSQAAITHYIPLVDDKTRFTASLEKLIVGIGSKGLLERYELKTGKKELTRLAPGTGEINSLLTGSASRGPILLNRMFVDLQTLKLLPIEFTHGQPPHWAPVSADGSVYGSWKPDQESTTFIIEGSLLKRTNAGALGHVVPGPDGKFVYTARGLFTNTLQPLPQEKGHYLLPAVEGPYFLEVWPSNDGGGLKVHLLGAERPVAAPKIAHGIRFDGWDRSTEGPWNRIYLIPSAKVLVIFPHSGDRLVLHRLDIDEALEKSGIDYLLVTSRPPSTVERGSEFRYQTVVKSKQGKVKYQLSSGPESMKVSDTGLVTWSVPARGTETTADVILTIRDASDQEVFHTFTLQLAGG